MVFVLQVSFWIQLFHILKLNVSEGREACGALITLHSLLQLQRESAVLHSNISLLQNYIYMYIYVSLYSYIYHIYSVCCMYVCIKCICMLSLWLLELYKHAFWFSTKADGWKLLRALTLPVTVFNKPPMYYRRLALKSA